MKHFECGGLTINWCSKYAFSSFVHVLVLYWRLGSLLMVDDQNSCISNVAKDSVTGDGGAFGRSDAMRFSEG